jgi:predicted O-methyltransferase YrrM
MLFRIAMNILKEEGPIAFAKKFWAFVIKMFYMWPLIIRIERIGLNCSPDELVDFVFSESNTGKRLLKIGQSRSEILNLLQILEKPKPRRILEIGSAYGGTLFLFSRIASEGASIISIDKGISAWRIPLFKSFATANQEIHLLRRDSHNQMTLAKVKAILNDAKLDFLFIDGDHSYEGVKKDFEMYSPLLKKNGMVAFHDIVPHPLNSGCEVSEFWNEIKQEFENIEIVRDWNQGAHGIGAIIIGVER